VSRRLPEPRWQTPLPAGWVDSWGPDVAAIAQAVLGFELDLWQRKALNRALLYGADHKLLHRLYVVSTARQQGKTGLVRALIAWALTNASGPDWHRIIGLAHDKRQARLIYEPVMTDLEPLAARYGPASRGGLNVTRYLGIRSGMYGRAREYHVGSREARDALRGETTDLGVFDEVRTQKDHATWAALEPTTTSRPEPLIFGISTAGDDRSVLLREFWERGVRIIDGAEPMTDFGMTWYASSERYPPDDPRSWREANPSLAEGRIAEAALRSAVGTSGGADTAMFRSERLNLWADAIDTWLPLGVWARQTVADQPDRGRVVFGVETTPSWGAVTVTVAWATDAGAYVGVAGFDRSTLPRPDGTLASSVAPSDLTALLSRLQASWGAVAVACVGTAAAFPHVDAWAAENDIRTVKLGSGQMRAASELFRSELIGGRLTHPEDADLAAQVRDVRPSHPIESGSWYLSARESKGPVEAIRAAAWAAWAAIAPEDAELPPQIFV
jgi:hypothetical protein